VVLASGTPVQTGGCQRTAAQRNRSCWFAFVSHGTVTRSCCKRHPAAEKEGKPFRPAHHQLTELGSHLASLVQLLKIALEDARDAFGSGDLPQSFIRRQGGDDCGSDSDDGGGVGGSCSYRLSLTGWLSY